MKKVITLSLIFTYFLIHNTVASYYMNRGETDGFKNITIKTYQNKQFPIEVPEEFKNPNPSIIYNDLNDFSYSLMCMATDIIGRKNQNQIHKNDIRNEVRKSTLYKITSILLGNKDIFFWSALNDIKKDLPKEILSIKSKFAKNRKQKKEQVFRTIFNYDLNFPTLGGIFKFK